MLSSACYLATPCCFICTLSNECRPPGDFAWFELCVAIGKVDLGTAVMGWICNLDRYASVRPGLGRFVSILRSMTAIHAFITAMSSSKTVFAPTDAAWEAFNFDANGTNLDLIIR